MKKLTQRETVAAELKQSGEVSNVWAVQHQILRLSERIRELQAEGWQIEGEFVRKDGKKTGTYRYTLKDSPKEPEKKVYMVKHPFKDELITSEEYALL